MTAVNNIKNPNRGLTNYQAQFKVVAVNPLTSNYLHMSGSGETSIRDHAWVGTRNQFANLQGSLDVDYDLQSSTEKVGTK